MSEESIEKNISKNKPRTEERDVWKEFHKYVSLGNVDKVLELANFLHDQGRKKEADKVLNKAYEIEGQNFREKAKELLEGFDKNKDNEE